MWKKSDAVIVMILLRSKFFCAIFTASPKYSIQITKT